MDSINYSRFAFTRHLTKKLKYSRRSGYCVECVDAVVFLTFGSPGNLKQNDRAKVARFKKVFHRTVFGKNCQQEVQMCWDIMGIGDPILECNGIRRRRRAWIRQGMRYEELKIKQFKMGEI